MEKQPLISVIIPVYNVEQYLEECIESILKQTYGNLDIILVDDGSKDNSGEMCDRYAGKDRRIRVLHKENGGLMSAWKAGVEIARGEYLVFVDSDDWVEGNMIEELVKQAAGVSKEMVCSNYIIEKTYKKQSVKIKQSMVPKVYHRKEIETELFPYLLGVERRRIHASRCMKLISKELILDNLQYTNPLITMGEDLNIMFPALLDTERLVVLEEGFFYHYRFVDESMVHKYQPQLKEKITLLYLTLREIIQQKVKERKEEFLENLKKEFVFLMFYVLKNELRGPGENRFHRIVETVREAKDLTGGEKVRIVADGKANQLLYEIWKRPGRMNITVASWLIHIFDRR